jgi:hypothetical protein
VSAAFRAEQQRGRPGACCRFADKQPHARRSVGSALIVKLGSVVFAGLSDR